MTETEKKALALVNEACKSDFKDLGITYRNNILDALLLAIEQHEAFKREVSDAVEQWSAGHGDDEQVYKNLARFIIPKTDPLVEVIADYKRTKGTGEYATNKDMADALRAALAARGLEVRKIGEGGDA